MDIDVLLLGEEVVDGQDFRVPHRGISRAYNLVGLADFDPSVRVPGGGGVMDLLAGADLGGLWEYGGGEKAVPATLRDRLRAGQVRRTGSPAAGYRKVGGGRG